MPWSRNSPGVATKECNPLNDGPSTKMTDLFFWKGVDVLKAVLLDALYKGVNYAVWKLEMRAISTERLPVDAPDRRALR